MNLRTAALFLAGCAVLLVPHGACGDVTSGLFSRYTFDADASDSVGSNHGTLENGASIVLDGERGYVLSLDGADDYVALPKDNMAAGRSEITVTMWIKPDEWVSANAIYDEYGGDWDQYWQFSIAEGKWYTRDSSTGPTGGRDNDLSLPAVPTGQWHHLAFVYSVSGGTKAVYYDGAPHGSTTMSIDTLTADRAGARVGYPCDGEYYDGMMDELRFYDRALTPSEIAILADQTTYTLTVNSGSGDGDYIAGAVATISADPPGSGYAFDQWVGDTEGIANVSSADTTLTMPAANVEITATYTAAVTYYLTVNSGTGDGYYEAGAVVPIAADAAPSGKVFDQWIGDTASIASVSSPSTTLTMPAASAEVTATYTTFSGYYLTVNSGSGSGTYPEGAVVSLVADSPPSGYVFNMWVGDPDGFASWDTMKTGSSNYTMPASNSELTATYRPSSSPVDWWPYFTIFCMETFGAEIEPLTYEMFGNDLAFMGAGQWQYASETSACIGFETNLPAKTYVEYGKTVSYGSQVNVETDRYYYLHLCHLTGLDADTTYHYRFVAEDERGNVITSSDDTFTTATPANVIYVPAGVSGPPYNLTQSGKTYLLTQDLVCDRTAFNINNSNITLDLGGHTVIYNQEDYQVSADYRDTSSMGVRTFSQSNVKILNGVIRQGLGYNSANEYSLGYSPVYMDSTGELAGVSVEYVGVEITGLDVPESGAVVHHNVVLDRGGDIDDRHNAKRARQRGINCGDNHDYYNNEIYVDSCATNALGVSFYKSVNSSAYGNRVFGTGYMVVAISTVSSGIADIMVHDNFVHLQATRPDTRWPEYGAQSGAYCCRITWGGDNIQYYDNVMVTYGRDEGMVRGTWFSATPTIVDCVFRDNTLKAVLTTLDSTIQGCIVHVGDSNPSDAPIVYSGNRLISNFCNARLGEDYYGCGCNAEFYDNTFVNEGPSRPDYRTIGCGYGGGTSTGHKFFDSIFEAGTGYDHYRFDGTGPRNFSVGWTLSIETEPYADITIKDAFNTTVFTGQADDQGQAETLLYQYLHEPSGKTFYTPHNVTVEKGADSTTVAVTMDAKKTIQVYFNYTLTVNSGSGDGNYDAGEVVAISADPAPTGYAFAEWIGDTEGIADVYGSDTSITMPSSDAEITATYSPELYTLTVNSGSGGGQYAAGTVVSIAADAAPMDKMFDEWSGDTDGIDDVAAASTTITMPAAGAEITATYKYIGDLDGNGSVGQGDLDLVLDDWGQTVPPADPRADPSGDNFVGQIDLDYVLDHWGNGF